MQTCPKHGVLIEIVEAEHGKQAAVCPKCRDDRISAMTAPARPKIFAPTEEMTNAVILAIAEGVGDDLPTIEIAAMVFAAINRTI